MTILQKLTDIEERLGELAVDVRQSIAVDCGCPGGDAPNSESVLETADPPIGFEAPEFGPPSAEYDDRKCKLANILHQEVSDSVDIWIVNGLQGLIDSLGIGSLALIGGLIGVWWTSATGPFAILGGVAGTTIGIIAGIVLSIAKPSADLGEVQTALAASGEELVCALYTSTSAIGGRLAYLAVLNDAGLSLANQGVVAAILVENFLNVLYFNPAGKATQIEELLDGYTPPFPCDCDAPVCFRVYYLGQELSSGEMTLDAEPLVGDIQHPGCGWGGNLRLNVSFDATPQSGCPQPVNCGTTRTMTSVSVISGAVQKAGGTTKLRFYNLSSVQIFGTDTLPWTGSVANVALVVVVGLASSPYQIRMTWTGGP